MKLLLDENLSPTLIQILSETYPETAHVGSSTCSLLLIPRFGHTLQTTATLSPRKMADFHHRNLLYGHPPKVIWIRLGNCSTHNIAEFLIDNVSRSRRFFDRLSTRFSAGLSSAIRTRLQGTCGSNPVCSFIAYYGPKSCSHF